eukprot:7010369-Pyramimonas_sp.AAC.1
MGKAVPATVGAECLWWPVTPDGDASSHAARQRSAQRDGARSEGPWTPRFDNRTPARYKGRALRSGVEPVARVFL